MLYKKCHTSNEKSYILGSPSRPRPILVLVLVFPPTALLVKLKQLFLLCSLLELFSSRQYWCVSAQGWLPHGR